MRAQDFTGCTYRPVIETVCSLMTARIVPCPRARCPLPTMRHACGGRRHPRARCRGIEPGAGAEPTGTARGGEHGSPRDAARTDVRAYALNSASRRAAAAAQGLGRLAGRCGDRGARHGRARRQRAAHLGFSSWGQCVDALAWIVDAPALDAALQQALQFAPLVQRIEVMPDAAAACLRRRQGFGVACLVAACAGSAMPMATRAIAARLASQPSRTPDVAHQWFRCARRACACCRSTDRPPDARSHWCGRCRGTKPNGCCNSTPRRSKAS